MTRGRVTGGVAADEMDAGRRIRYIVALPETPADPRPGPEPMTIRLPQRVHPFPACMPAALLALLVVLPLLGGAGCSRSKPAARVALLSAADGRPFEQLFSAARYARSDSGNFDVVLVDQTEGLSRVDKGRNKPLISGDSTPLTHVMHVRVLWRPTQAIRAGAPSASNATVHWTVLSRDGGRLDYTGAGFARVFGGGDPSSPIRVQLSGVRLAPAVRVGDLEDPIGAANLSTAFRAYPDQAVVRNAIDMIRAEAEADADEAGRQNARSGDAPPGYRPTANRDAAEAYRGPTPRPPSP